MFLLYYMKWSQQLRCLKSEPRDMFFSVLRLNDLIANVVQLPYLSTDWEGKLLLEDCSLEIFNIDLMVLSSLVVLIADGTLMTYHYHKNLNGLLRWLKEHPPQGIDNLSPINPIEQCEEKGDHTVEVAAKIEDFEIPQYQYPDISQGESL